MDFLTIRKCRIPLEEKVLRAMKRCFLKSGSSLFFIFKKPSKYVLIITFS